MRPSYPVRLLGEILSTINGHAVPVDPTPANPVRRKAAPVEKWTPAKRARLRRLERLSRKARFGVSGTGQTAVVKGRRAGMVSGAALLAGSAPEAGSAEGSSL